MAIERKPKRTQIGEAWNHRQLVLRTDALLRRAGVEPETYRHTLTAHTFVAIGWAQNCWWYNAWAVQLGSWKGDWYVKGSPEETKTEEVFKKDTKWRAFDNWRQAIDDTLQRIGPNSWKDSYKNAYAVAVAGEADYGYKYWEALGKGGYYTDKPGVGSEDMTPPKFQTIVNRVERELREATPEEVAAAEAWVDEQVAAGLLPDSSSPPADDTTSITTGAKALGLAALALGFYAAWKFLIAR